MKFDINAIIEKSLNSALKISTPKHTPIIEEKPAPKPATQAPAVSRKHQDTDFALDMIEWCNDEHDISAGELMIEM